MADLAAVVGEDEAKVADAKLGAPMRLAQQRYQLSLGREAISDYDDIKASALKAIEEAGMAPYYESMCSQLGWDVDTELLARMQAANKEELAKLEEDEKDAELNHGETEVLEAILARADFYARIGDKKEALSVYLAEKQQKQSTGQKIDVELKVIRLCLMHGDTVLAKEHIDTAKELVERGGDWDRRNRLKVYEGTYCMATRDFASAAQLFLDSIATFTSYEMFSYNQFVFYLVTVTLQALDRKVLRTRVVESPEVLSCILELPVARAFLESFHKCNYSDFFAALVDMHPLLVRDRYVGRHVRWYVREMRVRAYSQFLESYRSVTISSMAASFGIGGAFLDTELSRFIAAGRLNAKIDKINEVIETTRPDAKNAQYEDLIKKGDALLNRIQQLARIISV